jgi:hypothetical protein
VNLHCKNYVYVDIWFRLRISLTTFSEQLLQHWHDVVHPHNVSDAETGALRWLNPAREHACFLHLHTMHLRRSLSRLPDNVPKRPQERHRRRRQCEGVRGGPGHMPGSIVFGNMTFSAQKHETLISLAVATSCDTRWSISPWCNQHSTSW